MKTYMTKTFSGIAITAIAFSSIVWVYAMSDTDFKKGILMQIQKEDNLTDTELQEIKGQLEDISREDILSSLLKEIKQVQDTKVKATVMKVFDILKEEQNGQKFFSLLDNIYQTLDTYYMENEEIFNDDFQWKYNFDEEKKFILENLDEEIKYISDKKLKVELTDIIVKLKAQTDEDIFFETLDSLYTKIDTYYGIDLDAFGESWEINWKINFTDTDWEYNFDDLKTEILESLIEERTFIKDKVLKAKFETIISSLKKQTDEDKFFKILDEFYSDKAFEKYYESQGIDLITGVEFLDGELDFNTEKLSILEGVLKEIWDVTDVELKAKLESKFNILKTISNEDEFFDSLDDLYESLDEFYGEGIDIEFNFQDEKIDILQWVQEEISSIKDVAIKTVLQGKFAELQKITDEDSFFLTLEDIYNTLNQYYEVEGIEYYNDFTEDFDVDYSNDYE